MSKVKIKCQQCGKEFEVFPCEANKKYCSSECYRKVQKDNIIEIRENYAVLIIKSKKYGINEILIDKEDIEKVSKYQWHLSKSSNPEDSDIFYVKTNDYHNNKKHFYLHRYLMNCPDDKCIDHINHNTFDNRKENLRICTIEINNNNMSLSKANKTGHKHIAFDKRTNKFILSIKGKFFGRFKTIEEALRRKEEVYA